MRPLGRSDRDMKASSKKVVQCREDKGGHPSKPAHGEKKTDDHFVCSKELMTRLSGTGEAIFETLFNTQVINGKPDSYD